MSVVDLTGQALQGMEEARKRSELFNAFYLSASIAGIGSSIFLGWFLYKFFTDAQISLRNSMGEVVQLDFPAVNPWLASPDAREKYILCLEKEYKQVITG